jgi:type II secretory pathway pseudopilin PulG
MCGVTMKTVRRYTKKGFTIIELLIALVLSIAVLAIAARLFVASGSINSLSSYFVRQETQTRHTAEQINNAIKYTNALFTIPQKSFTKANLTKSWSYLGIMEDVFVPYELMLQRNGHETADEYPNGTNTRALVYIKYIGSQNSDDEDYISPSKISNYNILGQSDDYKEPVDQYVYAGNVEDGYFLVTVIDYELYDERLGYKTRYELVFNTTNDPGSSSIISDSIQYNLKVTYLDRDDNVIGEGRNLELETMLNGINLLQAVYQGSRDNPATAIAFHEDGFNVSLKKGGPHANIIFVLDVSTSMEWAINRDSNPRWREKSRIQILQENVLRFLDQFKMYENVYIGFVQFSRMGESVILPIQASRLNNPNTDAEAKKVYDFINGLHNNLSNYTNIGDGLRVAYSQFEYIADSHINDNATNFLILMTDGASNTWSTFKPSYYPEKYGSNYTDATRLGSIYNFPEQFPHKDDLDDFFWSSDNINNYPEYLVANQGQSYYVPKSKSLPRKGAQGFSSIAASGRYTLGNSNNKFDYSRPSWLDYSLDYIDFCADKIINAATFKNPVLKYFSISRFQGHEEQADAILDAFEVESSRKQEHVFSIDDEQTFITSITKLASDIENAAWLLDGPRV